MILSFRIGVTFTVSTAFATSMAWKRSPHQAWLIHIEHACYFATGILVWWPLVQNEPRRLASGARAAYAFAAFVFASPLGLLLALVPKPAYPGQCSCCRPGLSARE